MNNDLLDTSYEKKIQASKKLWLITGVAGFIGSNLLEKLLKLDQNVVGLDNFSTGYRDNLDDVKSCVTKRQWRNFKFIEGDITSLDCCLSATNKVDYVLHQAALGSVPRSIEDPIKTNKNNIDGFLNILQAARLNKVDRFVFAASSSTYGDHPALPKTEDIIGNPLSPYAVTKYTNELYARVFSSLYEMQVIGLRYFNIFGPRQDPNGAYAAVIPKWIESLINKRTIEIFGDGETTRDFCFINNAVQANLLAATCELSSTYYNVFNIAYSESTSLNELYNKIYHELNQHMEVNNDVKYTNFRAGDVRHSLADIDRARSLLGYKPSADVDLGLEITIKWFISKMIGL